MEKKAHLRSGLRIAIAVALVFLTVVSPLCAPLCAATTCASGNSSADPSRDDCHHASASISHDAGAFAAPRLCNLKELPTAALRDVRSSSEQHAKCTLSQHTCVTVADKSLASRSSPTLRLLSPATSTVRPLATTILRI
jgi:hypothetical protein